MFSHATVIRCKSCTRLFSSYADNCPDCHARSPRGWFKFMAPILAVMIALAAIFWIVQALQIAAP
jgi:hypothetical protein